MIIDWEARYLPGYVVGSTGEMFDRACPLGPAIPVPAGLIDPILQPVEVRSEVREYCTVESALENSFNNSLGGALPDAFVGPVSDSLRLINPASIGLTPQSCNCDAECVDGLSPRGRCVLDDPAMPEGPRSCRFGAELDRLMLMPEGVVFVYAESVLDDFQGLILVRPGFEEALFANLGSPALLRLLGAEYSCGSGRAPVTGSGADPDSVTIRPVFDPSSL